MSDASDLIERAEREAGCRIDDPDNHGALFILMGAMARALGTNPHGPRDDYAAGALLAHQMSERGRQEQASKEMMAALLTGGISPDDLGALMGRKR